MPQSSARPFHLWALKVRGWVGHPERLSGDTFYEKGTTSQV